MKTGCTYIPTYYTSSVNATLMGTGARFNFMDKNHTIGSGDKDQHGTC